MKRLEGKTALVTGASRGVGRQIAQGLAREGARVLLHSRSLEHTRTLCEELRGMGCLAEQLAADMADPAQVEKLIQEVLARWGTPDILYNNAAVMTSWHQDWLQFSREDFDLSFRVNVTAPISLAHAFLPGMLKAGWGRVVNLTSGIKDQPELMAYAASKAALDKFVQDTAPKLAGTGVALCLLDPGWLRTDLGGPQAPGAVESVLPGALMPALDGPEANGRFYRAQDWHKA